MDVFGGDPISVLPSTVEEFCIADEVHRFDGDAERHGRSRAVIDDAAERARIARYLRGAEVLEQSQAWLFTLFDDPAASAEGVPLSYYTDGTWIWSDGCAYHLIAHHHAPQPEFLRHIAAAEYRCASVSPAVVAKARSALRAHREIAEELHLRSVDQCSIDRSGWANDPPTVPYDPDRMDELLSDDSPFTVDVEISLMGAGWQPGRDAGARVTPWLTEFCAREGIQGRRHQAFPAAVALLAEFGLLDMAEVGYHIHFFPLDAWIDPVEYAWYAEEIGTRLFPIGLIEDCGDVLGPGYINGRGRLFVDETGRILARYDNAWYLLGEDLGSALDLVLNGGPPAATSRGHRSPGPWPGGLPAVARHGEWTRLNPRWYPFNSSTSFRLAGDSIRLDAGDPEWDLEDVFPRNEGAIAEVEAPLARELGWRRAAVYGVGVTPWLTERAVEIAGVRPGAFRRLSSLGRELGPPSPDDIRAWFSRNGHSPFNVGLTKTLVFDDGRCGYLVAGADTSVRDELIDWLAKAVRRLDRALRSRGLRVLEREDVDRDDPRGRLVVSAGGAAPALRIELAEDGWFATPDAPGAESRLLRRPDQTGDVRVHGRNGFDDLAHDVHAILLADALRD
ncbi:SUKH-3 domain-containing protein [Actinoallomurus sp. NBC_01490]|uniref:SUKH-3 domain-containing protein n=1 Tax=Actinoallomurus sp. NBC_01490 TaxID=2903557 RepID=UPI002E3555A8|nr:SUKH-3 domain-containing protein [Actinoallomurus sp. NBC_01490]